jgi:hypothetical protein
MEETKIIYYTDDATMPYLIKLNIPPERATLRDFKLNLNTNPKQYKFFFQTIVADFGTVKEELADDEAKLPCVNGRVVCWLVQAEGSVTNETTSNHSINEKFNVDGNHMKHAKSISSNASSNTENIDNMMSKNEVARKTSKLSHNKIYASINEIVPARKNSINMSNKQAYRNLINTPLKYFFVFVFFSKIKAFKYSNTD